jgi:hypothetical protein
MPISNKSSQKRMTETTIRLNSNDALKRPQAQRKTVVFNDNNSNYTRVGIDAYRNTHDDKEIGFFF